MEDMKKNEEETMQKSLAPSRVREVVIDFPGVMEVYDENSDIVGDRLFYWVAVTEGVASLEVEVNVGDRIMYLTPKTPIEFNSRERTVQVRLEKRRYVIRRVRDTDPQWMREEAARYENSRAEQG